MTIPNKSGLGDYKQEESWGYFGHKVITFCNAEGNCQNSTLTTITPNHIEFLDSNNNTVHLMRFHPSSITAAPTHIQPEETNNVTILYYNGENQSNLQNYTGAKAIYQKALAIDPDSVKVLADMGRVLYNLKNYTSAFQSLDKAIRLDPSYAYAYEEKGWILYHLGYYREALVSLNKTLELDPNNTQTMDTKGSTLSKD
jgi:tetratricopeptide (TPR) repeat protein